MAGRNRRSIHLGGKRFRVECESIDARNMFVSDPEVELLCCRMIAGDFAELKELSLVS
jgi:hypothetical protein